MHSMSILVSESYLLTELSQLSLASPVSNPTPIALNESPRLFNQLSYTKGTSIPVALTIQCSNPRALDLLSSPKAPRVVLLCVVYNQYDALSPGHMIENRVYRLEPLKPATRILFRDEVELAGLATWWPETPQIGQAERSLEDKRVLQGEIHLRP